MCAAARSGGPGQEILERCQVRGARPTARVGALSGGNQQKVLFARMLLCEPRLLIADEPTRGVDVGAKRAIYEMLVSLAQSGMGILLISSELEEILGLSDRVVVMRRGRTVAELSGAEMNEASILAAAFSEAGLMSTVSAEVAGRRKVDYDRLRSLGILIPFAALFVILSLSSGPFFTKVNMLNILDQQSATLIVAAAGRSC